MDQEKENNNNDNDAAAPDRLERMWKSHPWQSDVSGKPSLGPAPSASRPPKSRWAAPWRKQFNPDAAMPPPLTDDDISLGESLGEDSTIVDSVPDEKVVAASPPRVASSTPVAAAPTPAPAAAAVVTPKAKPEPPQPADDNITTSAKKEASCSKPLAPPATTTGPTEQEIAEENAELLAIDFHRDGAALREAIAEDVLAMWEEQGLYQDMPDLRDELLRGIVDQKFVALQEEQAKVLEQKQLAGMPKLAASDSRMDIITEEEEEEEETSDEEGEEDNGGGAVSPPLEEQEATMTPDERIALHAFQVQEELEVALQHLDTSDHYCLEASGRLGNLTEQEQQIPIKDYHAFNKFKLHDAVERRVSKIFTEDHHVVTNDKQQQQQEEEEEEENDMDVSSASLPVLPSQNKEASVAKVRDTLSASFSAFDALLSKKPTVPAGHDDEWTEYEETIAEETAPAEKMKPQDIKKLVADMDKKLGLIPGLQADDDESFMEYTVRDEIEEYTVQETVVHEEVDVDELSEKRDRDIEVDIDELSEKREKEQAQHNNNKAATKQKAMPRITRPQGKRPLSRLASAESSYMEVTVTDETVDHARRNKPGRESMVTASGDPAKKQAFAKQSSMTSLSGKFPTITMTQIDDDELTQITFDHTVGDLPEPQQEQQIYRTPERKTNSPVQLQKCGSGGASQNTSPTRDTVPLDESSYTHHSRGSLDSSSQNAASATAKSVAKILRVEIWSPKSKVVSSGMEKLANAASQGSYQRANIARLGGAIAILRAMQSHPRHLQIQRSGCTALAHLSVDEDTQEAIGEVGGAGAIVTAMECHPSDQEVQEAACVALANITSPRGGEGGGTGMSDSEEEEDSPSAGSGVVQALVTAMNRHPQNADIQARAFIALSNLCLDNQGRLRELSESGGLTAMTMALQKPWANKMEQHEAISTLSILLRSLAELGESHC